MADPDYYALIGVDKHAKLQEIRTKFRQKVLEEHPDKGGDPKKFQLLNKAYQVLTDKEKRQRYDDTGKAEKTAEEEFVDNFAGGRHAGAQRPKEADAKAVVNLHDRISTQASTHEDGFAEWLRARDQESMVLTDKDFMRTALYNAAELSTKVQHEGPVHHILGSPNTNSPSQARPVDVEVKRVQPKRDIEHDELLVRMLAVPVDNSMIFGSLDKSGTCLGMTGIGRIEQAGARMDEFRKDDVVLVLPKPTKFSSQRPIGTARTLLVCNEEDVIRIPAELSEELTAEQLCLTPTIICAYCLLDIYGARLQGGDAVLLNAAHLSASGAALLQLCRLLKLKPLCIVPMPGTKPPGIRGEYGTKAVWKEAEPSGSLPPSLRAQYERICERLTSMGAEEVFPDAVSLLRWRERNQRLLPKLGLDGLAAEGSAEQLIHCLQSGDKDAQLVVYGHGSARAVEISPPLLCAWGGALRGFDVARWTHALTANAKKMMASMENITKLVRANKFSLETLVYKVGEDPIAEAFSRAADASDHAQVVLTFPSLQEELRRTETEQQRRQQRFAEEQEDARKTRAEEDKIQQMRDDWLKMLFTSKSVAALSPEGPLPTTFQMGNTRSPQSLIVWVGDEPRSDGELLKDLPAGRDGLVVSVSWSDHSAGEALGELSLKTEEVMDGSWYLRDASSFDNGDCDILHDVELLSRALVESIKSKLDEYRLTWRSVVVAGFGKGAGIALYASLLRLFPRPVYALVLFNTVALFPTFIAEKHRSLDRSETTAKIFTLWGSRDKATPNSYRQVLTLLLKRVPGVQHSTDMMPEGDHKFDRRTCGTLESLLPLCVPR